MLVPTIGRVEFRYRFAIFHNSTLKAEATARLGFAMDRAQARLNADSNTVVMTTTQSVVTAPQINSLLPMPDPPERRPEEISGFNHLGLTGSTYLLTKYFGHPDTTLVAGEHYIAPFPTRDMAGIKFPDLMIAFKVNPEAYRRSNAYIISEQGKPPDFVLEIASRATGYLDVGEKRDAYAALGILEYWRFDDTGRYHGSMLAGDRLEHGTYRPIAIEELEAEVLQGYSAVLNLHLRWEYGKLGWYDPTTGRHIPTYDDQVARAEAAEWHALEAEERAEAADARARKSEAELREERKERVAYETRAYQWEERARELEKQLRRRRS